MMIIIHVIFDIEVLFFMDDNLRSWVVHALDGEIPLCSWSPMSWTSFNLQAIGRFPPLITGVLNPLDTWNGDAVPHDIPILSRDIPLPRCLTWFQSLNYHGAANSRTWNIPWNHLLKLFRSPCFAVADYCTLVFFFSLSSVERFCGLTEVHLNFEPWLAYNCGLYSWKWVMEYIYILSLRWISVGGPSTVPIEFWSTRPRITVSYTQSAHSLALRCHEGCRRGVAIEILLGKEVKHEGVIMNNDWNWPV